MKKYFNTALAVMLLQLGVAQEALKPQILSSPTAKSMGKYGFFPVSHYTGQANVQIPITNLEANGVKLDVGLSYDGSGIMVDHHPGWVGQNWSLHTGGVITRSVHGQADEVGLIYGPYYYNIRKSYITAATASSTWLSESNTNTVAKLKDFALDRTFLYLTPIDTEPDIFSFNFFGMSGKFYLNDNAQWTIISDQNLKIEPNVLDTTNYIDPFIVAIPANASGYKYEKVIAGFKITDEHGYKYTFGYQPSSIEYSIPFFKQYSGTPYFDYPNWIANAWYITKVEDYRGNIIYSFDYQRSYFIAQLNENYGATTASCKITNGSWVSESNEYKPSPSGSLISPVYLQSITTNKQDRIEFKTSNTVEKKFPMTPLFNATTAEIYNELCPGGGCPLVPYPFLQHGGYYSYDTIAAYSNPMDGLMWRKLDSIKIYQNTNQLLSTVKLNYNNTATERLNLLSVDFVPITTNTQKNTYSMSYNAFGDLPDYFSKKIDHFGYYNGTLPYDNTDHFDYPQYLLHYYDSRNSVESYLLKGQLTAITYPTGGRSEFDYEINDYHKVVSNDRQSTAVSPGSIGGLRIKAIRHYDGISATPTTQKRYSYKTNYHGGGTTSSGILALKPTYVWIDWLSPSDYWPAGGYKVSQWTNNILVPLANKFENYIGYKEVTEINGDSSYIVHKYVTHEDVKDELPYSNLNLSFSPYARFGDKSHMRGKEIETDYYANDNAIVKIDNYYYDFSTSHPQDSYISTDAGWGYVCGNSNDDKYYRGNAIKIYSNKVLLDSIVTKDFFGFSYIKTKVRYVYDRPLVNFNRYAFLSTKYSSNSDNIIHQDDYSYSYNYTHLDLGQRAMLDSMEAHHRLDKIYTGKRVDGTLVDATRTWYMWQGTHPMPQKMQRYEYTYPVPSTVPWQDIYTISSYDLPYLAPVAQAKYGWLTEYLLLSTGRPIQWSYGSHTRSLAYTSSNLLQSITDIDGQSTAYEYDGLSRIKKATMLPKNTTSTFDYHFSTSPTDRSYFKAKLKYPVVAGSLVDSLVAYTYLDGLGRELQTINMYGGADALTDVMVKTTYDHVGRVSRKYNPQAITDNHGSYVTAASTEPYALTTYKPDPLNRTASTTPPSWYASTKAYSLNFSDITSPDGTVYHAYELYKESMTDPDGKKMTIYKDKLGLKVAEESSNAAATASDITWYLYDGKQRLSKVIPPGASLITPSLIYEYRYDGSDNVVYKKIPDAAAEEYVYNSRDLPIGMRNGVLTAQGKWLVTHYDDYGRPTKRGYHNLSGTLPSTDFPTIHTTLEEYFYDGYNGTSTNTAAIYKGKLKKKRIKALDDLAANTTWQETEYFYDSYGRVSTTTGTNHRGDSETTMMSYDFADHVISEIHNISGAVNHVTKHTYDHQGRLIDDKIKLDGGTEYTTATHSYNHRSEVIERNIGRFATTGTHQYLQSLDYTYNAQGWLTKINELFTGTLPSGPDPCSGSGTSTKESSESSSVTSTDDEDLFALKLDYDISVLGQPINKNGNITGQTWNHRGQYPQSYGYTYDYLNRVIDAKHYDGDNYSMAPERYTEKLVYDIRGNITNLRRLGVTNRTDINTSCYKVATIDSLAYTYGTNSNILTKVEDMAPCPDVITLPADIDRDVHYAANQKIIIDHTTADCHADLHLTVGNLPTYKKVEVLDSFKIPKSCAPPPTVRVDVGPCPQDHYTPGFNQQSIAPYQHDASGNMTYDPHKKLTFHYNYLNLPYKIIGAENDELQMLYAADGTLLQRKYIQNNAVKHKVDYIADKEYHNDTLEYVHHAHGRAIKHNATWQYEYSITDHLGNVRATFCDLNGNGIISNNERRSRLDYYTFGMEHYNPYTESQYSVAKNNYKYNGKEVIEEMNIGLQNYGMRMYDNAIGRFTTTDRFAHKYAFMSPYQYGANNPVKYVDVNGDSIRIGNQVWTPGATYSGDDEFTQLVFEALNFLFGNVKNDGAGYVKTPDSEGNILLDFVSSKTQDVSILPTNANIPHNFTEENGKTIYWNPNEGIHVTKGISYVKRGRNDVQGDLSATTLLAHEIGHAWLAQFSPKYNTFFENYNSKFSDDSDPEENKFILPYVENKFARARGEGVRTWYNPIVGSISDLKKGRTVTKKGVHSVKVDYRIIKK